MPKLNTYHWAPTGKALRNRFRSFLTNKTREELLERAISLEKLAQGLFQMPPENPWVEDYRKQRKALDALNPGIGRSLPAVKLNSNTRRLKSVAGFLRGFLGLSYASIADICETMAHRHIGKHLREKKSEHLTPENVRDLIRPKKGNCRQYPRPLDTLFPDLVIQQYLKKSVRKLRAK